MFWEARCNLQRQAKVSRNSFCLRRVKAVKKNACNQLMQHNFVTHLLFPMRLPRKAAQLVPDAVIYYRCTCNSLQLLVTFFTHLQNHFLCCSRKICFCKWGILGRFTFGYSFKLFSTYPEDT